MQRGISLAAIAAALCTSATAAPVKIQRNSPALEFTYQWSSEAAAIPSLDKRFRSDMQKALRQAQKDAAEDQALARGQKRPFNQHYYTAAWETLGETARLLSLEGTIEMFAGGAHPNHDFKTLLWDRRANKPITVGDLFIRPASFGALTRSAYCKALDAERAKRRDGAKLGADFEKCPAYAELAIGPADSDKNGRFDKIDLIAPPYVAGPYVEGEYSIELPVSRQLIAAIKPSLRLSFEPQRQ